jgi:hypothetical protein
VKIIAEKSVVEVMGFLSGEAERKLPRHALAGAVGAIGAIGVIVWLKPCGTDESDARTMHRTLMRNSRVAHHYLSQPLNNGAAGNAAPQGGAPRRGSAGRAEGPHGLQVNG